MSIPFSDDIHHLNELFEIQTFTVVHIYYFHQLLHSCKWDVNVGRDEEIDDLLQF